MATATSKVRDSDQATPEGLAEIGVAVGNLYDDVWHGPSYITKVKLIAVKQIGNDCALTFNVEGTKTYSLIPWSAITKLTVRA